MHWKRSAITMIICSFYKIFACSSFSQHFLNLHVITSWNTRKMHISAISRSTIALGISLGDGNVFTVSELQISPAVWPHSHSPPSTNSLPNLVLDISAGKYGLLSTYRQVRTALHVSRFPRWRMESSLILSSRFPLSRFHSFSVLLVCSAASITCPDHKLLYFDSSQGIKSALS